MTGKRFSLVIIVTTILISVQAYAGQCPALLTHTMPKLHSTQQINLCEAFKGKPLLIVNTASYCGFTGQFRGLEALYDTYREQGLEILGVPSNSFNQEAMAESETAAVCYKNYGVTFTMTSAQAVTGAAAHPLYKELTRQSGVSPGWNFHKYLINGEGQVVAEFPSHTKPSDSEIRKAIETELASVNSTKHN
jgi:glutathione peroxidase